MQVDPRAIRFAAAVTSVILALVLVTGSAWLLAVQAGLFLFGAVGLSPLSQPASIRASASERNRTGDA